MGLFLYFPVMKVYAMFDGRRDERDHLVQELQRQGIDAELMACPHFPGETAIQHINYMHKLFVREAQRLQLPEVCILEADVLFPHPEGWKYFLANKPEVYDLYLGGTYGEYRPADIFSPDFGTGFITHLPVGLHCYCIHERYYDKFLATADDAHIDTAQRNGRFVVCFPMAAIQRPSRSAISKAWANYNHAFDAHPGLVYGWEYYNHADYPEPKRPE